MDWLWQHPLILSWEENGVPAVSIPLDSPQQHPFPWDFGASHHHGCPECLGFMEGGSCLPVVKGTPSFPSNEGWFGL